MLKLQQMAGVDDFQLVGNKLVFTKFNSTFSHPNHARYDFRVLFSNGGKLNICVSVPQVIIIGPLLKFLPNLKSLMRTSAN